MKKSTATLLLLAGGAFVLYEFMKNKAATPASGTGIQGYLQNLYNTGSQGYNSLMQTYNYLSGS